MSEFESLKAGDEVVVAGTGFGATKYALKKVERVTKTQIVIGKSKYRRSDGWEISDGWHRDHLMMPTEKALQMVNEYNLSVIKRHVVKDLKATDWDRFTLDQLKEIGTFIAKFDTPE